MSLPSIEESIHKNLERYFRDLDGQAAHDVYQMVILAIEKPMLEVVMKHAQGNQSVAARILGINRNTLHKKLCAHGLNKNT